MPTLVWITVISTAGSSSFSFFSTSAMSTSPDSSYTFSGKHASERSERFFHTAVVHRSKANISRRRTRCWQACQLRRSDKSYKITTNEGMIGSENRLTLQDSTRSSNFHVLRNSPIIIYLCCSVAVAGIQPFIVRDNLSCFGREGISKS